MDSESFPIPWVLGELSSDSMDSESLPMRFSRSTGRFHLLQSGMTFNSLHVRRDVSLSGCYMLEGGVTCDPLL